MNVCELIEARDRASFNLASSLLDHLMTRQEHWYDCVSTRKVVHDSDDDAADDGGIGMGGGGGDDGVGF